MEIQATGAVIDGSALARGKGRGLDRVSTDSTPTDPDRAIETARRTVVNRAAARSAANRVKDGQSLGALKATSGPPGGAKTTSSLLATPDQDRSRTSLFDLPSSGGALIDRMRGQVRPSSPLNGLLGGINSPTLTGALSSGSPGGLLGGSNSPALAGALSQGSTGGLLGGDDGPGLLSGLVGVDKSNPLSGLGASPLSRTAAQSVTSGLRSSFDRISNSSRSLLQENNPLRTDGGFGLQLPTSSLNLLA
ncbi:MAG: hypothetical protein HOE86_26210 [Gemmatimonadetes bacterium]|nr:hypothetical protein [Gemmatimonadota bacterium]